MKTFGAMVVAMSMGCSGGALQAKQPQCSVTFGLPSALAASTSTSLTNGIQIDGPADGSCNVESSGEMTMTVNGFSFTVGPRYLEIHDKKSGTDCTATSVDTHYFESGDWTFDVMCGGQRVIGSSYWRR